MSYLHCSSTVLRGILLLLLGWSVVPTAVAQIEVVSTPVVGGTSTSNVTSSSVFVASSVTNDGGATVTRRGFVYGTARPLSATNGPLLQAGSGKGAFSATVAGLQAGTVYYIAGFAENTAGITIGPETSFTTSPAISVPSVTLSAAQSITTSSAVLGGQVVQSTGGTVTRRGMIYGTGPGLSLTTGTVVDQGSGLGVFAITASGLPAGRTHYYRAFAVNSQGIGYSTENNFTTLSAGILPQVTSTGVQAVTTSSAIMGGNVFASDGGAVTRRGVLYGLTAGLSITNATLVDMGTGLGVFSATVSGFSAGRTYYYRAFATSAAGTGYGVESSFATDAMITWRSSGTVRMVNTSTRVLVGTGQSVLITGVLIVGDGSRAFLVRGVGPGLAAFGVSGVISDPVLQVFDASGREVASNDNWNATLGPVFSSVGAFALPAGSRDAALLVTLRPGTYTFQVSGVNGTGGIGLVELYQMP